MSILLQQQATSGLKPPRAWVPTVLAAWTLTPILLWQTAQTPATPDLPPFGATSWFENAVRQWEPEPPATQPRRLTPQGVPPSDPPFGSSVTVIAADWEADWPRQGRRLIPQDGGAAAPAAQPYTSQLEQIIASWQAQDAAPVQKRAGQIVSVDNPPLLKRAALPWDADPQPAQGRRFVPIPTPDNPPFGAKPWVEPVLALWEPEPWSGRARILAPIVPASTVDDPPFGQKTRLSGVIVYWQPPDPPLVKPQVKLAQGAPSDNPPFGAKPWAEPVLALWEPEPWSGRARILAPIVPASTVDNPPFGAKPWVEPLLALWEPEPLARQIVRYTVQSAAADNPPFAVRAWRSSVLDAWEAPAYRPQVLTHVVQGQRIDNPPFAVRAWMGTVLSAWQPAAPERVVARHETEGSTFVSPVYGWGARSRIGSDTALDEFRKIGSDTAKVVSTGIGTSTASDPNKAIGSSKA